MTGSVDIVVPFHGSQAGLDALVARLTTIPLDRIATLTVVDNRAEARPASRGPVQVEAAPERRSSYHARNRGATCGSAKWILFLDADVVPPDDLIESYFARPPAVDVAVLAGGIADQPPVGPLGAHPAVVYAHRRGQMSQLNTLRRGPWAYAQTGNCAIRRRAFDAIGGFEGSVRSAGDADLCFRLVAAGWRIEARPEASVVHCGRHTVQGLVAQRVRHGAGVAWVNRRHPGSFPPQRLLRWPALAAWSTLKGTRALRCALAGRRGSALLEIVGPLGAWAFEAGRLTPSFVDAPMEGDRLAVPSLAERR